MLRNKVAVFLVVVFLLPGYVLSEKKEISSSLDLKIIAHYKDKIKNRIFARGNVEVHYKDIKLFAEMVELDTETKDVFAEGDVVIQLPEEVLSAEKIHFNLDSTRGELQKVFGMIKPNLFYEAKSIERKDENLYSFKSARITSCTQSIPRWNFSCSSANFKKDQYMEMWNSVVSIKKIPVFYFPYLRYPIRDRATGFLMPQLGHSKRKGYIYSQSFYWAMRRNMDSTFNFDYYSAKGLGGGLEYRYLFPKGTGGLLNLYYFTFKKDPERENPDRAYLLRFEHNQSLPFQFSMAASVDYQSSYDFLREFSNDFNRAVVTNRRSQAYLTRSWSYVNLSMRVSRFETYYQQSDKSYIRYNLPEVSFSSSKIKIFTPLYFSFSSSFNRFEFGWGSAYEAGTQKQSQGLVFKPVLNLPITVIPWLPVNFIFSNKFNYYFNSYEPNKHTVVNEPLLDHIYAFGIDFAGPVFYKIFSDAKGAGKLKHIIEPSFSYYYESPISYPDRIIDFRSKYRLHLIKYGLTNRILIKHKEMPKEIFVFGLEQIFYIAPEESPLSRYDIDGKVPEFGNINGYLRFYPASNYQIDFSASFNPYFNTFSGLRVGANLGSFEDLLFLRVNWYKSINPYEESAFYNRHQISCLGGFRIPRISLKAYAQVDFNIQMKKMLYSAFGLTYRYQCIDFKTELKVFYFREKPDTQFRISFGLGNIGKTTDFLGGMEF